MGNNSAPFSMSMASISLAVNCIMVEDLALIDAHNPRKPNTYPLIKDQIHAHPAMPLISSTLLDAASYRVVYWNPPALVIAA